MDSKFQSRIKSLVEKHERLGHYTSDTLAKGFDEETHGQEYAALMDYLGKTFPIPVLEQAVKHFRAEKRAVLQDIKEELFELGSSSITMDSLGVEVSTKQEISAKIANDQQAFAWLEQHGYGAIVKNSFNFQKGVDLSEIEAKLKEIGMPYDKKSEVHHASLKKAITELIAKGGDLPESDIIQVDVFDTAEIKKLKTR